MHAADNGTSDKTNRSVKGSAGTSGRVRKALPARRSAMDGNGISPAAPSCKAVDGGTTSNVGGYLSDSIDDGDDDEVRSEEVGDVDNPADNRSFILSSDHIDSTDLQHVDPDTRDRLQALLEAAGLGLAEKFSASDAGQLMMPDPDIVRQLTSVSYTLDGASAALNRVAPEHLDLSSDQAQSQCGSMATLTQAYNSGNVEAVRVLLKQGDLREGADDGDSLLSLAASAGYYELCQMLISMKANIEDKGVKGDCTPLMEAANAGYVDIVQLLIANGADVNAKSTAGNTALHYAACSGHEDVVRALVQAGAHVEDHNENGHTPLMEAASAGFVGVAKIFLSAGAGINTHSNEFKESALTLACYKGHLEMVKFLLEAGADQEHKTDEMHTALMEASMDGHVEVARLLLDHGAQVNMPADSFESPLTLAACGGHVELANLLIERGANLEEANDEGYTPLMEAAREGHEEMVALLLAHGADINAQTDETQETALTLACCGGFLEVADFLIKAAADIELGCSTPLMEAAQEGHLELVKYLLKAGANIHAHTQSGDTALTYACENGHTDVAEVLLEHGAELEHEAEGGRTALMKAARVGHLCTVQYLISQGADVNKATANHDHTVLSLACAGGHIAVVELLLKHGSNVMQKLKDGSTMLIEAAKGGHANVVNLLLDWSANAAGSQTSNSPVDPSQTSPSQLYPLDYEQIQQVSLQKLGNIVAPHTAVASFPATSAAAHPVDTTSFIGLVQPPNFNTSLSGGLPTADGYTWVTADSAQFAGLEPSTADQSSCCRFATDAGSVKLSCEEAGQAESAEDLAQELQKQCTIVPVAQTSQVMPGVTAGQLCTTAAMPTSVGLSTSEQVRQLLALLSKKDRQVVVTDELQNNISKLLLNIPNTPSVVQLLGLAPSASACESHLLQPDYVNAVASSSSDMKQEPAHQLPVTAGSTSMHESPVVESLSSSPLDVANTASVFHKACKVSQPVIQQEAGGSGDADSDSMMKPSDAGDACCGSTLYQSAGLQHIGGGDDLGMSPVALLSNQTEAQLQELFRQQQWHVRLNQMMQLDVMQQHSHAPLVVGADTAASLLWHQQQQQPHITNPTTVSFAFCNDDVDQQQQQVLLQQPQTTVDMKYEVPQQAQMQAAAESQQMQSPRQQKPRLIARAQRKLTYTTAANQAQQSMLLPAASSQCMLEPYGHTTGAMAASEVDKTPLVWQQRLTASSDALQNNVDVQGHTNSLSQICQGVPPQFVLHHYQQQQQQQAVLPTAYCLPACDAASSYMQQQLQCQLAQAQQLQQLVFHDQQQQLILQPQSSIASTTTQPVQYHQLTAQKRLGHMQQPQTMLDTGIAVQPQTAGSVAVTQTLVGTQPLGSGVLLPQGLGAGAVMPLTFDGSSITPMMPLPVGINANTSKVVNKTGQLQLSTTGGHALLNGLDTAQLLKAAQMQGFDYVDQAASAPLSPNPSPASPLMTPPVYPMSIEVDAQTEGNHDTALTLACAGGHTELVTLLLARGAAKEHRDKKGFTPLIHAATAGHTAVVEILLDHGVDIEAQSERTKDTALSLACSGGRYEVVELLLQRGANREHRNVSDYTPLALAASGGYVNIIRLLLSHGAEINSRTGSKLGISPLMLAAMNGHAQAVSLLVDMGSDINAQIETNRNTALTLACFQGRHEVVSILVDKRANIEHRAKTGLTPLMEAASGGYVEVGRVLLDKGADIAAAPVPSSRDTALTIAADKGHYRFVELLVQRGGAVDARNKKGQTALWLACNGGHIEVVQLLVTARADADAQDNRKVSCLMAAFRRGHVKVVRWLVRHVAQFPSDTECQRFIAAVTDNDLLKRCQQCMEAIMSAKERQAAEANKNAAVLLEELDAERNREESRRAKLAKKREKKRQKKRERQVRDQDMGDLKADADDDLDRNDDDSSEDAGVQTTRDPVTLEMVKEQEAAQNERERASASVSETPDVSRHNDKKSRKTKKNKLKLADAKASDEVRSLSLAQRSMDGPCASTKLASLSYHNSAVSVESGRVPSTSAVCLNSSLLLPQLENIVRPQQSIMTSRSDDVNKPSFTSSAIKLAASTTQHSNPLNGEIAKALMASASKSVSQLQCSASTDLLKQSNPTSSRNQQSSGKSTSKAKDMQTCTALTSAIMSVTSTGIGDLDDFGSLPTTISTKLLSQSVAVPRERAESAPIQTSVVKTSTASRQQRSTQSAASQKSSTTSSTAAAVSSGSKKIRTTAGTRKEDDPNRKCQRIAVPAKAISRIIGRAGCNINAIREATGAQVDLDKLKNSADAVVTIRGSADASRVAHDLVVALIRESDKDIEQLIPQMKTRAGPVPVASQTCVVMPAPPPPDNVWKSNMARSIPASAILAQSATVTCATTTALKAPLAVTAKNVQLSLSASVMSECTSSTSVEDINKPQPIGTFRIDAWTPVTIASKRSSSSHASHNAAAAPGHGRKEASASKQLDVASPVVTETPAGDTQSVANIAGMSHQSLDRFDTNISKTAVFNSVEANHTAPFVPPSSSVDSSAHTHSSYSPFNCRFIGETPMQFGGITVVSTTASGTTTMEQTVSPVAAEALQAKAPGYRPQVRTSSPRVITEQQPLKLSPSTVDGSSVSSGSLPSEVNRQFLPFSEGMDVNSLMTPPRQQQPEMNDSAALPRGMSHRDEYSSSKNPMTLPRIGSNLNPNAPDFTCKISAANDGAGPLNPLYQLMQQQQQKQQPMPYQLRYPPPHAAQLPAFMQQMMAMPCTQNSMLGQTAQSHPYHPLVQRPAAPRFSDATVAGRFPTQSVPRDAGDQSAADVPAVSNAVESLGQDMQQHLSMNPASSVFNGVGGMSAGTSANDLTPGSSTSSPAVNEHVYAPLDDKRMLEPAAFEERRSMQPIGTERMNKKPRTTSGLVTAPHGTPNFTFMPPTNVMPPWAASSMHKSADVEWLKSLPSSSSGPPPMTVHQPIPSDMDDPRHIQQMLLAMHSVPPAGSRWAAPPVGIAGVPRAAAVHPSIQHANHVGVQSVDSAVEHSVGVVPVGRPPHIYHNGMPNQMPVMPNAINMHPPSSSSVPRSDDVAVSSETWSDASSQIAASSAPPVADHRPMWSNIWTSPPN